jgi:nucleotide-binding universal stress UspA family protein
MYRRILVATDGSELSAKAVDHAFELARAVGAKVTAFYAPLPFPMPVYGDAGLQEVRAKQEYAAIAARDAGSVFAPIERQAARAGIACDLLHAQSEAPWQAILAAAHEVRADVIVMASHGRRGVAALLLGSETANVLTHSTLPVLVVR